MSTEEKNLKRIYSRTTFENRLELINMVQKDKETIKNAAKMLNIKESTAKLIVSRFRTSGTVFKTKEERISMIKSQKRDKAFISGKSQQIVAKFSDNTENQDHRFEEGNQQHISQYSDFDFYMKFQSPFYYPFMPVFYSPL